MPDTDLPPCGLYRTTEEVAGVPAGRLVYFHNHGNPGPGLYLPGSWQANRATFQERGFTLLEPAIRWAAKLEPLPAEGLYRVTEPFHCCEKQCRLFERELLVQVGYDGDARALLFVPEWTETGLAIPQSGSVVELSAVREKLEPLKVPQGQRPAKRTAEHLH